MGHGFRGLVACNRRIGTSERIRESFSFGAFPSLQRRGGCGINKKSRSHRSAADGVVAHTQMFQSAFRDVTRERPPRPRLFGTGPFFDGASTPPLQGGEWRPYQYVIAIPNMRFPGSFDSTLQALQDFLPAVGEEGVLNFVDDEDFLVLEIHCSTSRGDKHRGCAFDCGFRRYVAVVGVIPDAYEGFAKIGSDVHAARF